MPLMGPTFRSTSTAATAAFCFVYVLFCPRGIAASLQADATWDANWTIASAPFGEAAAAAGERKLCMGHELNLIGVSEPLCTIVCIVGDRFAASQLLRLERLAAWRPPVHTVYIDRAKIARYA